MADKDFVVKNGLIVGDTATINGVQIDPSGASSNQVLKFDGTKFAPAAEGAALGLASVSESVPSSPSIGQLWFDSVSGATNIYYDSQWIEVGGGGTVVTVSDTAPASPALGQVWFNSSDGGTYVYYDSVWTEIGAVPPGTLNTGIDAKGDLLVGTANDTLARLATGTNDQVLTVDTSTATGLKWSTPTTYATTGKAIAMAIVFGG